MSGLTEFQIEVARLFFSVPASKGFLLAGGGALLATGLTSRQTQDLDFFGESGCVSMSSVKSQFLNAVCERSWTLKVIQSGDTFVRVLVIGPSEVLVDIAIDVGARHPAELTFIGPTFSREELAGRKLLALLDRAEARDFADVYVLANHFGKELVLLRASEIVVLLDRTRLSQMMYTLSRFSDSEIPCGEVEVNDLREFFAGWANELLDSDDSI